MEYGVPHKLVTPAGDIDFNPSGGGDGYYLSDLVASSAIRGPVDDLPQHDGGQLHRFFRSATYVTMRGEIHATGFTARRQSEDKLRGYTDRLLRPTNAELVASCRLRFTPSGYSDERLIDAMQLQLPVAITGDFLKQFEFTLASPYPYAIDLTQTTTAFAASATHTITNNGNATVYPVIQVDGAFSAATIANTTTGQSIVFAAAGVAGGHYAEIDCFRKTVFLDGSGVNLLGKIDFTATTLGLGLVPGANSITFTGAGGRIYWNHGWIVG